MIWPSWADLLWDRIKPIKTNRSGEWVACCPSHDDTSPSVSISLKPAAKYGERLVLYCNACGAKHDAILKAIGLDWRATVPPQSVDHSSASRCNGAGRNARAATHGDGEQIDLPPASTATLQHSGGCTLQQYAEDKRLPLEFLEGLGLVQIEYCGLPTVSIPYRTAQGAVQAVRLRKALKKSAHRDERFCWQQGSKICLYGLDRIEMARAAGYVVGVEGESDCHTLWCHGEPAFGFPGANTWKEDRDAHELDGIPVIYIVIEPDTGGSRSADG